jgi:hypothetical protein
MHRVLGRITFGSRSNIDYSSGSPIIKQNDYFGSSPFYPRILKLRVPSEVIVDSTRIIDSRILKLRVPSLVTVDSLADFRETAV